MSLGDNTVSTENMKKLELLKGADFGDLIAERERDQLARYFVKTGLWEQILDDEIDLILGDKGTGKSAIFVLMQDTEYNKAARVRTVMKSAENIKGTPAFKNLATDPPQSQKEIALIWKLHFLALAMQYVDERQLDTEHNDEILNFLKSQDLYHKKRVSLSDILLGIRKFVKMISSSSTTITISDKGEVTYGIGLGKYSEENIAYTENQVDKYLKYVDELFDKRSFRFWILLDRLDVAFEESNELESNALRALLRVYVDFAAYFRIKLKIFLREDVFDRITDIGFREATHITKYKNLSWSKDSLINVIANRIVHNQDICEYFNVDKFDTMKDFSQQKALVESIFNVKESGFKVLDYIFENLADGKGRNCPRDMIGLLKHLKSLQISRIDIGAASKNTNGLFDQEIINDAIDAVCDEKIHKVLYAEYHEYKKYVKILDGMKNGFDYSQLKGEWGVDDLEAIGIIDALLANGFFIKNNRFKTNPIYVSPIYARSLSLS